MPRPNAPSMPTERQIRDANKLMKELYPNARISRIGPEGVTFDYPAEGAHDPKWDRPFGSAA